MLASEFSRIPLLRRDLSLKRELSGLGFHLAQILFAMQTTIQPLAVDTPARPHGRQFALLSLAVLGGVYADIGTTPLSSVPEAFHAQRALPPAPPDSPEAP